MSKIFYMLAALANTGLSVFGVRSVHEQPAYTVVQTLTPAVQLRTYGPRTTVQTDIVGGDQGQAFGKLFRYITGANAGAHLVAMTVPVEQASPTLIPMTVPVETSAGAQVMRFFLPHAVVAAGVPKPTEAGVRVVVLPAVTLGVIRYSGTATEAARDAELATLRAALARAGRGTEGSPLYFSYDPPFSVPFLRRNEVALAMQDGPAAQLGETPGQADSHHGEPGAQPPP